MVHEKSRTKSLREETMARNLIQKLSKFYVLEIINLKAYDNLLEFKATENVFSMSNVWQEI